MPASRPASPSHFNQAGASSGRCSQAFTLPTAWAARSRDRTYPHLERHGEGGAASTN